MRRAAMTPKRIAAGLFLTDVAITLAYLINVMAGSPFTFPGRFLDLDGEANLPTWYASAKLLTLGLLLFIFASASRRPRRRALLFLPAVLAVALSLDEVASIHEWIGLRSDAFLPGADRKASLFPVTGFWVLLAAPVALASAALCYRGLRPFLQAAPAARRLFAIGFTVLIAGAMGAELTANFVAPGTWHATLQVAVEEGAELAGTSTLIWAALELLAAHGLAVVHPVTGQATRTTFPHHAAIIPDRHRST